MSKSSAKKNVAEHKGKEHLHSPSGQDDLIGMSRGLTGIEQPSKSTLDISSPGKSGLKREFEEDDDLEYGHEMNTMMQMFGSDMSKALHAKKKRIESFTLGSLKANQKLVLEPWESQLNNSREMDKELYKLTMSVLEQAESDITSMKEHDEKIIKIFQQQIKTNAQHRATMLQRVVACRQVMETYLKKTQDQAAKNRDELTHAQYDLKKELATLQKKMLNEGQKEEMDNVKKNLTKMFYMHN